MNYTPQIRNALAVVFSVLTICAAFPAIADKKISLPGDTLFPEGIAADSQGGLYIGSLAEGRILYLEPDSFTPRIFAQDGANGLMSVGGLLVSPEGETLYVCNSDIGVSTFTGLSKPGLVAFDTKSGFFKGRWDFPGGGLCNDLTMMSDGTILMTDSFIPRILALKPGAETLIQWAGDDRFNGEGFNLNGITLTDQGVFVVKFNSNELFRISINADGSAGPIDLVELSRPLGGPDGIKTLPSGELLVVEGEGRLSRIKLEGLYAVIETIAAGFDVPTTAAVLGNLAYVVEAQLDHLPFPSNKSGLPKPFTLKIVALR